MGVAGGGVTGVAETRSATRSAPHGGDAQTRGAEPLGRARCAWPTLAADAWFALEGISPLFALAVDDDEAAEPVMRALQLYERWLGVSCRTLAVAFVRVAAARSPKVQP